MDTVQFILSYTGKVVVNNEYTVDVTKGSALQIDWFRGNDIIIETPHGKTHYNTSNTTRIAPNRYLIEIERMENLDELPIRFERGDYLVAGNVVIDHRNREYFTADKLDILDDEIVATHGGKMTRITFDGHKATRTEYVAK